MLHAKNKEAEQRMLHPTGAPASDFPASDYSLAIEYSGPPLPFEIPQAIPIEMEQIPVASVASLPSHQSLPVAQPLPSPEPSKRPERSVFLASDPPASPDSVIAFEHIALLDSIDHQEVSGEAGGFRTDSSGAVGFSSEFKESAVSSNDRFSTGSVLSSEFLFRSSEDEEDEDDEFKRASVVTFHVPSESSDAASCSTAKEGEVEPRIKKGSCYRCLKGNRFTEKEACLVCNAKYCSGCVLRSMGSMPEGRKCVSCIGFPIEESKRERLGKCSRLLKRLLSSLEIQHVMKAEKCCDANQLRPEHICVNGKNLCQDEMILLQNCPTPPLKLKPGYYWYDKVSGFWGKEGHKPHKIISPHLNIGGSLMPNASNGNTGIFINGREITKDELRMLKLAGVQCAGNPHFWVNADGTYQEEGQKNLKGNLWGKAGMKLVCSILSLPLPCKAANANSEDVYDVVNKAAHYYEQRSPQKLLLVGYYGSGTSVIFKQAKFLYRSFSYSQGELETIKLMIQSNIYNYLAILLEGREQFEDESLFEKRERKPLHQSTGTSLDELDESCPLTEYSICPRLKVFADWLLKVRASGNLEAIFPAATREYAPLVEELWGDAAIQATYRRRSELELLPKCASYFLQRVVDITRVEYEPSNMDILHADGITSSNGVACTDFLFPTLPCEGSGDDGSSRDPLVRYQLIRVHMKGLGENCKWLDMFEDVRIIIFCIAVSDYDEFYEDASGVTINKMMECKRLFESITTHPTFNQMDFLLILNKFDLLEQKIDRSPLTSCDWFDDFNPVVSHQQRPSNNNNRNKLNKDATLAQQAFHYIAVKFKRLFYSLTGRKLYVTLANGLDSDSVDATLRYAKEIVNWEEERTVFGTASEFSAYSTEPSSFSE